MSHGHPSVDLSLPAALSLLPQVLNF